MSQQNLLTRQSATTILSSRILFTMAMVGEFIRTTIVGNPTIVPVERVNKETGEREQVVGSNGQPLMKAIYNVKATSQVAQQVPDTKKLLVDALAADKAGDAVKFDELMNKYLNKVQVSFSVILNNGQQPPFVKGQIVDGVIAQVTTDKGSILSLDNVVAPQARMAKATKIASLDDLLGSIEGEDAEDAEDTTGAGILSEA